MRSPLQPLSHTADPRRGSAAMCSLTCFDSMCASPPCARTFLWMHANMGACMPSSLLVCMRVRASLGICQCPSARVCVCVAACGRVCSFVSMSVSTCFRPVCLCACGIQSVSLSVSACQLCCWLAGWLAGCLPPCLAVVYLSFCLVAG